MSQCESWTSISTSPCIFQPIELLGTRITTSSLEIGHVRTQGRIRQLDTSSPLYITRQSISWFCNRSSIMHRERHGRNADRSLSTSRTCPSGDIGVLNSKLSPQAEILLSNAFDSFFGSQMTQDSSGKSQQAGRLARAQTVTSKWLTIQNWLP